MPFARDPVSELFDAAAAALLKRAHARRGAWQPTLVKPPDARQVAWAAGQGINVFAADPHRGELRRWERGFIRSLYYIQRWHMFGKTPDLRRRQPVADGPGALRYDVGAAGPGGILIWARIDPGGKAATEAVSRLPAARRYTSTRADTARSHWDQQG